MLVDWLEHFEPEDHDLIGEDDDYADEDPAGEMELFDAQG